MNKLIISIFTLLLVAVSGLHGAVTNTVTDNYGNYGNRCRSNGARHKNRSTTTDMDGNFTLTNVPLVNKAVVTVRYVTE